MSSSSRKKSRLGILARMNDLVPVKRALLSVYHKEGLCRLGAALAQRGVELLSTGGTARTLRDAGLKVKDVSEETRFPEMMDGRVKTLHPRIHGALLGRRDVDAEVMAEHAIRGIDLVVCNLYPFENTVRRPDAAFEDVIEQIDIGGPSMIRSAAKNHRFVAVVTDHAQYDQVMAAFEAGDGALSGELRLALAKTAFARTAAYDAAIARWLSEQAGETLPESLGAARRERVLRYGENPHQEAALYVDPLAPVGSLATARVCGGKALSFNNYGDVESAWALVREFDEPACVVVKHANPCGAAVAATPLAAYEAAVACDPRSAFGGIVALNRPLEADVAAAMAVKDRFLEVVIAPGVEDDALACFAADGAPTWGKSLRVLDAVTAKAWPFGLDVRSIDGGVLVQTRDHTPFGPGAPRTVTKAQPTPQQAADMHFAWRVCKHVRSNAIVLALGERAVGVGAGQMSRVEATELAVLRARRHGAETGTSLDGMVAASDAFYPFNDGIEAALDAGASAIVQPGGSRNDENAIGLCDERGIPMWFAGHRHFRH
jgi:phosphoribosylaminoimidazolecarboxamide formyltransferase/IMP cyclohydrolase